MAINLVESSDVVPGAEALPVDGDFIGEPIVQEEAEEAVLNPDDFEIVDEVQENVLNPDDFEIVEEEQIAIPYDDSKSPEWNAAQQQDYPQAILPSSGFESLANAVIRGFKQGQASVELQKESPNPELISTLQEEIKLYPASKEYGIVWNDNVSAAESWEAFKQNPVGSLAELIGESLGTQARTTAEFLGKIPERTMQGLGAGTVAGIPAGPAGMATGGTAGLAVGALTGVAEAQTLASYAAEYGGSIIQSLQEEGVDVSNQESLQAALQDPDKMTRIRAKANSKAVPISVIDGALAAIGGKLFTSAAKSIVGRVGQWATELGVQTIGGTGGEAISQLASEGKITSPRSIIAEGAAEVVSSVPEVAIGRTAAGVSSAVAGQPTLAPSNDPQVRTAEEEIKLRAEAMMPSRKSGLDQFIETGAVETTSAPVAPTEPRGDERFAPPPNLETSEPQQEPTQAPITSPAPQPGGETTITQPLEESQAPSATPPSEVPTITEDIEFDIPDGVLVHGGKPTGTDIVLFSDSFSKIDDTYRRGTDEVYTVPEEKLIPYDDPEFVEWAMDQFGFTNEEALEALGPDSIVDSGGLWDNRQDVSDFWQRFEGRFDESGFWGIRTPDGAAVFPGFDIEKVQPKTPTITEDAIQKPETAGSVLRPTEAQPQEQVELQGVRPAQEVQTEITADNVPLGTRVQLRTGPQTYQVVEKVPQTPTEIETGEQFYRLKSERATGVRAGEEQVVERKDMRIVGQARIEKRQSAQLNERENAVLESPPLTQADLQSQSRNEIGDATAEILGTEAAGISQNLGITPGLPRRADIPVTSGEVKSNFPNVEKRWKQSRVSKKPTIARVSERIESVSQAVIRPYFAQNLDPKTDGQSIEWMRQFIEVPQWARTYTQNILSGLINPLGNKGYDVYARNIILADLIKDVREGMYIGKDLPFGYKSQADLEADFKKFSDLGNKFSEVRAALDKRRKLLVALRDNLVSRGLLNERVQKFDEYYRHQVLEYYNAENQSGVIGRRSDRRKFGWQKARTGSSKDYNTDYLVAEAEYLSQAFAKMRAIDMLARLKESTDISPTLLEEAKKKGVSVDSLIPSDYSKWSPTPGNVFYWTKTLPEKVLDQYFNENQEIMPEQIRDTLSVGGKRDEWIIPKGLAKDLDNLKPKDEGIVANMARSVNSSWKYWTLLNPTRALKYNLNNLSGDSDALAAYDPGILKLAPGIAKEIFPMFSGKKPFSNELIELTQKGVLSSGITAQEIENISDSRWFNFLKGGELNPIKKYFATVEDATNFREAVFRVAAYRRFLARLEKGEQNIVAASDRAILEDIPNIEDKAARLARELVGDYGAIGLFGKWMRERLYPFWSWKEINTKRYWRLLANAEQEGLSKSELLKMATAGRITRGAGKTVLRGAQAAALYGILNLWNNLFFPDEEEELGDDQRRQLHLILGRDSDGNILSLRVQGAFSDFLGWVGAQDFPTDVREVAEGKKSVGDIFQEGWEAFAGNIINGSVPLIKATGEALTGKSLYPNPFEPRPIRDSAAHLADLYSVGNIYRKLNDIPIRGGVNGMLANLIFYTSDPGEAAYYTTRSLVADFLEKEGVEQGSGDPTKRSNALYYYKQSLRYGDRDLATKWLNKYYELGGTPKGMKLSIDKAHPLGRLKEPETSKKRAEQKKRSPQTVELREKFEQSLSPADRETIKRALRWYNKVYQYE